MTMRMVRPGSLFEHEQIVFPSEETIYSYLSENFVCDAIFSSLVANIAKSFAHQEMTHQLISIKVLTIIRHRDYELHYKRYGEITNALIKCAKTYNDYVLK